MLDELNSRRVACEDRASFWLAFQRAAAERQASESREQRYLREVQELHAKWFTPAGTWRTT